MVHAHLDRNSSSEVTAAAVIANDAIVRGDGGGRGIQGSGVTLDDSDNLTGINNITGANDITASSVVLTTPLVVTSGGTGTGTYTTGDILYADASNSLATLAAGSNTDVLTLAGGVPTWAASSSGVASVADGGTGRSSATAYAVICGGTTSTAAHQSIAGVGSSGEILTSNGAAALPTFQAAAGGAPSLVAANYTYGVADFISANNNPNEFGRYSSGGSGGFVSSDADHQGMYQVTTSTSATGRSILYNGQGAVGLTGGQFEVEWCVNVKTALSDGTDTYTAAIGLYSSAFTTVFSSINNYIVFEYTHTLNSGNWTGSSKKFGAGTTQIDLGTAVVVDEWVRLKIVANAAGDSIAFYINGVEGTNSPITTNIANTSAPFILGAYIGKTLGTTSRSIYCDYCEWLVSYTSARND